MKNITVTVDDELYRRARIRAAEQGTTVSAYVKCALKELTSEESEVEARNRRLKTLFEKTDRELAARGGFAPPEPGWRNRMYDERFDETKLGQELRRRGS